MFKSEGQWNCNTIISYFGDSPDWLICIMQAVTWSFCVLLEHSTRLTVYKVLDFYFTALHDCTKTVVSQLQITTGLTCFRHDDETFLFIH